MTLSFQLSGESLIAKDAPSIISPRVLCRVFFDVSGVGFHGYRVGLQANWSQVFDLAAELDNAVEIDSYLARQDLNVELLKIARKAGCRISLGTDSHGQSQLAFIELGVAAALLSGIKRERVLNFLTREELLDWAKSVRRKPY